MIDIRDYWYKWTHPVVCEVRTLHRVTEEQSINPEFRLYEIRPQVLEDLILDYIRQGYRFVSMDEVLQLIQGRYRFPYGYRKNVAFTLDDGYADNFENAYPIFKKYNVPFCIYVCKQFITGETPAEKGEKYKFLAKSHLIELNNEPLCTIGCHTLSHPFLSNLPYSEQLFEIFEAKKWLEELLGNPVNHFAYPYGDYNKDSVAVVENLHFSSAVTVNKLKVRGNDTKMNKYLIPRISITN